MKKKRRTISLETALLGRTKLTGRGGGVLLVALLATVAGAVTPEPDIVRIGLLVMLLIPLAWPFARRNLRYLKIERNLPESCFAGQLFTMDLTLLNPRNRLDAFAVELDDGVAGPAERGLGASWLQCGDGVAKRTFSTRLLRRGVSHGIRSELTSTWPLGLWRTTREIKESVEITVFPRPVTPRVLEEATDSAMIDVEEAESSHRDWMGDFHGVRAFQPGDHLKSIHWPSTARARGLMVRQYDRPLPEKYFVVFHSIFPGRTASERGDAFESAMELLCGLLMHCRDHVIPLDLIASFDGWNGRPITSPREIESAMYLLAAARRTGEQDISRLTEALGRVERHTRVFILSDVPVKDWEGLLPEMPFEMTCFSVSEFRVKRPGFFKSMATES